MSPPAANATMLWPRPVYNAHFSTRHITISPFIRDSNQVDLPMSFPMDEGMLRRKISEDAVDSHAIPANPFEANTTTHSPIDISTDVISRNSYLCFHFCVHINLWGERSPWFGTQLHRRNTKRSSNITMNLPLWIYTMNFRQRDC